MDTSEQLSPTPENTYHVIRTSLVQAQNKLTSAVNSAMVTAYWEIGREIYRACGDNDRAEESCCTTYPIACPVSLERALMNLTSEKCVSFTVVFQFGTHCVLN